MTRSLLSLLVVLLLGACCAAAHAQDPYQAYRAPLYQPYVPPPRMLYTPPQPAGVWVAYRRPTPVGQLLFGDLWIWHPVAEQPQPQPQPQIQPPTEYQQYPQGGL